MHGTDRYHPIIERPWEYEITGFGWGNDPADPDTPHIDLVLCRGNVVRRLRFTEPRDLEIEKGFPRSGGLTILDVTNRQLEGIGVLVTDDEASCGAVRFWAKGVIDLDEQAAGASDSTVPVEAHNRLSGAPGEFFATLTQSEWAYTLEHLLPIVRGTEALRCQEQRLPAGEVRHILTTNRGRADQFVEACEHLLVSVGLRPDDEPNEVGLLLERLIDKFDPAVVERISHV